MKYNIDLQISENEKNFKINILINEINEIFWIEIKTNPKIKINEIIKEENIKKTLKKTNASIDELKGKITKIKRHIEKIINNKKNIIKEAQTIIIDNNNLSSQYIKENELLKTQKIILKNNQELDIETSKLLEQNYNEKNTFIYIKGNEYPISINEYKNTIKKIDKIIEKIKKYDLSPIEQIMYAYDIVREKKYKEESIKENANTSRDLSKILLGENIVCVGYANLFNAILEKLNIKSYTYFLSKKNDERNGHVRNIVHVIDKKYNINGIYYFDATWDSKKTKYNYLDSYRFFCKTKEQIEHFDTEYKDITLEELEYGISLDFEDLIKNGGIENVPKNTLKAINNMSMIIEEKNIIDNRIVIGLAKILIHADIIKSYEEICNTEEITKKLRYYEKLFFKNELKIETLIEILYNVRKIEYLEEPEKYSLDMNTIKQIIKKSIWIPEKNSSRALYEAIFGEKIIQKSISEEEIEAFINNYKEKEQLEKNIQSIKLIKTLKNIYNTKSTK